MKKELAGSGVRMSSGAPTVLKVSSNTPPSSIAMAPILTVKPSISSVEARPPMPVLVVDDEGMQPGMGKPRGGAKPAGAGPDHDSIRLEQPSSHLPKSAARLIPGCP